MKNLFVCASVLTLVATSLPAHANPDFVNINPYFTGSEEEQGKQEEGNQEEQGKQEEKQQEENKQEENKQEEENQGEQGRQQRGSVGNQDAVEAQRFGRFLCYARNVRGRTFSAQGFQRYVTQRRAVQNCRARSGFILGRTCNAVGCRRW